MRVAESAVATMVATAPLLGGEVPGGAYCGAGLAAGDVELVAGGAHRAVGRPGEAVRVLYVHLLVAGAVERLALTRSDGADMHHRAVPSRLQHRRQPRDRVRGLLVRAPAHPAAAAVGPLLRIWRRRPMDRRPRDARQGPTVDFRAIHGRAAGWRAWPPPPPPASGVSVASSGGPAAAGRPHSAAPGNQARRG